MKIGIAVPCFIGHLNNLKLLLESIEKQTTLPDKVVVSCSSTPYNCTFFDGIKFNYELEIIYTEEIKNAAQNRNIAISKLTNMDYITFIDADDIMHPQRIEVLLKVFQETNCDIILHNFYLNTKYNFNNIQNINFKVNSLKHCPSGHIIHKNDEYNYVQHIHHSQSSVKKYLTDIIRYREEKEFIAREDSIFCYDIFNLNNINNAYIIDELSFYKSNNSLNYLLN